MAVECATVYYCLCLVSQAPGAAGTLLASAHSHVDGRTSDYGSNEWVWGGN
jgi:hypothetical protein